VPGAVLWSANILSNPLMPNVPNLYAPWTYDEILITMPAQHTPVARPTSLLAANDVKLERTNDCVQAAGAAGPPLPDRPVARELPAWDDRS